MNCAMRMMCFGIVLLCFGTVVSATADEAMADNTIPEKTNVRRKPGRKAKVIEEIKAEGEAAAEAKREVEVERLNLPEDTSPRFVVKELQISGNNLVSTAKLLEKLPLAYKVSIRRDDTTVEETYDFRVLHEVIVDPGREREVSLKTIQGLTKYVLSIYRDKGYAGIYVYVPAEAVDKETVKLKDEILPIEVLEGKVAKISIERYDFDRQKVEEGFLKESVLESWLPIKEGEVIQKKELDDFVRLLNLNPDRYISAVISRSTEPDALNLGYDIYEANPWHWYLQVDNAGTKDRQWTPRIGVINTNLTGVDDRFSAMYQVPWEKGIEEEYSLFGSYDFPLFIPRLRLNLYAGYSQFDIPTAVGISFLGNGSFYGGILSYNVFQMNDWFFDVTGSLSRERSKVTPSLGLASDVDMDLWGVGINVHRSDDMSNTSLTFNRVESMGGSSRDEFALARLNTDPDFIIYNFGAAHSQYLDPDKINRLSGSFRLITSDERLVPAKMTTFGGLYSVRGYEEDEIVTDGGILVSGQYEFDLVKYSESREGGETESEEAQVEKPWLRKLAPLAFIDYGRAKIQDPVVGEEEIRNLCSIGVGTIVELGDNFSAGIYYGWPLRGTDDTDKGEGRLNLSFVYRF
ncbi:MAG: ShlB/FhaC/HecB family hemolysin secretion/activation protein [Planctomycetota bacterium]